MKERRRPEVGAEEGGEDLVGDDGRRHGQVAPGQALAEAEHIGAQPAPLAGEQPAGAPEPGGDLVGHEGHAGTPAGLAEGADIGGVGDEHARRPLHKGLITPPASSPACASRAASALPSQPGSS